MPNDTIDKQSLLSFIGAIDEELKTPMNVTAVGGTAMTLLDLKNSTQDVDFELETKEEREKFNQAVKITETGYKVDTCIDGMIFFQQLPDDFRQKSIPVKTAFKNIRLFALHPLDIVVTKLNRMNERDIEDIGACIKKKKLTRAQVAKRANEVYYEGNQENAEYQIEWTLKKFFP